MWKLCFCEIINLYNFSGGSFCKPRRYQICAQHSNGLINALRYFFKQFFLSGISQRAAKFNQEIFLPNNSIMLWSCYQTYAQLSNELINYLMYFVKQFFLSDISQRAAMFNQETLRPNNSIMLCFQICTQQ